MLFLLFTLISSILAFPAAGFQVSLPSFLRSSDGKVAYYSKQAEKYEKLVNDAVDKESKMFNAGKYLEATGKQFLHSLKNPKARADMRAKGYLDAPTTASKDFNIRKYLERLKAQIKICCRKSVVHSDRMTKTLSTILRKPINLPSRQLLLPQRN